MRYAPRHRHYHPHTQTEIVRDVIDEREVEIAVEVSPAEPATQFYPGCPPTAEVLRAIWSETKVALTEAEIQPHAWDWQERGIEKAQEEWRLSRDRAEAGE
jgi:hypothetical protein